MNLLIYRVCTWEGAFSQTRQELLVRMSSQVKCSPGGGPWGTARAPGQKYLLLSGQDLGLAPQLHQEAPSAAAEGRGLRVSADVLPSRRVKTSPSPHEQGVVLLGGHGALCDRATPPAPPALTGVLVLRSQTEPEDQVSGHTPTAG